VTAYEPDNVFAKIIRGEFASHKVFEDEQVLVVMDVFPQSRGHTLMIPKAPSRNLFDADPMEFGAVAAYLPKLARAVMAATKADGLQLRQYNETPAGQTVFHLHFHLIPVYAGIELGRHAGSGRADDAELAGLAQAIAMGLDAA